MSNKVYERINQIVIEGLEKKGLQWFKPWRNKNGEMIRPINNFSGKPYNGMNIFTLSAIASHFGYEHNEWLTFKQCKEKGGQIRKGEKSSPVFFYSVRWWSAKLNKSWAKLEEAVNAGATDAKKVFNIRMYLVWNIAQCDGIEPRIVIEPATDENAIVFTPDEQAEAYIDGYNKRPEIRLGGDRAYYSPPKDYVQMPEKETFFDSDSYYKTLFHELVHSTGHESRLNRKFGDAFGREEYAKEELIAEIGSMYLTNMAGLQPKDSDANSQAYLKGWIKKIKGDNGKLAANAMQAAAKAVDHILGVSSATPNKQQQLKAESK